MALFINFFITRIIKADGRGVYAIFIADIDLLVLFLGFTVTSAIVFFVANKKIAIDKLLGIGILTTCIGLVALIFLFLIIHFFSINSILFPSGHGKFFHYLFLGMAFTMVSFNAIINSIFQGKSLFRIVNRVNLSNSVINFVVFGIVFYLTLGQPDRFNVNHILLISTAVYFLNLIIWLGLYKVFINVKPVFTFNFGEDIKPLFVFVSIGHLSHILAFLTYRVDLWILEHYKGAKELGYYAQAMGFGQMFWSITNPILTVLIPYLASHNTDESKKHFKFYSRLNFTVILIGLGTIFLAADVIFPIYGKEFANSVLPFRIISIGILMSCIHKTFATYIYCQNKIQYNLLVAAIGFAITLIADLVLIPQMGRVGASIAASLSFTTSAIITSLLLRFKFGVTFDDLFFITVKDLKSISVKIKSTFLGKLN